MKSCVNCGAQLNDDEYYCEACGNFQPDDRSTGGMNGNYYGNDDEKTIHKPEEKMIEIDMEADEPIDTFNPVSNNSNTYGGYAGNSYDTPVTYNKKSNKTAKIVFAVTFVFALVIAGIVIKDRVIKDPRTAAEYFLDGVCDMDSEQMLDSVAGSEYADLNDIKEFKKMYEDSEGMLEMVEVSYTIKTLKELSDSQEKAFWNDSKTYNISVPKTNVKDVNVCKVDFKTKNKNTFISYSVEVDVYVGRYKGKWKVIGIDTRNLYK